MPNSSLAFKRQPGLFDREVVVPSRRIPDIHTASPSRSNRAAALLVGALALGLAACATPGRQPEPDRSRRGLGLAAAQTKAEELIEAREKRAASVHLARLEREVAQLRMDLRQAEAAMLTTDSEVSTGANRAAAVSMLVEARIALEQVEASVPWKLATVEAGRQKLAEGERQLKAGRPQEAVYFASRAQHIADSLIAEARTVEESPDVRFVKAEILNLRAGPSVYEEIVIVLQQGTPIFSQRPQKNWLQVRTLDGEVGWVYRSLVSEP